LQDDNLAAIIMLMSSGQLKIKTDYSKTIKHKRLYKKEAV